MESTITYTDYLNMPATSAGAIFAHILKRKGVRQASVAHDVNLPPQRIYDLIKGNRRFTPETSLAIEKCLSVDLPGFFYIVQAKHEVYLTQMASAKRREVYEGPHLPSSLFWEINSDEIDWQKDADWVVLRVVQYGDNESVKELLTYYGEEKISSIIESHIFTRETARTRDNIAYIRELISSAK